MTMPNTARFLRRATPVLLGFGVAVLALSATATQADDDRQSRSVAPGQCVSSPLDETRIIDDSTLYVDDYHGRAVLLHMSSQCLRDDHSAVGMKYFGTQRICGPMDVQVTGSVLEFPTPCIISSVEALSKGDAKTYKHGRKNRDNG